MPETGILRDALLFLVILNPFAQMVYLSGLINDTDTQEFRLIFRRATYLTFFIYVACAFVGDIILFKLFQVTLPTMRIFGGFITLNLAYAYVMKGPAGIKLFSGDVSELAQQIAMPVMVGAGGVWICIKMGTTHPPLFTIAAIAVVLFFNAACVIGYQRLYREATGAVELAIRKYFGVAMRFNALLIGAVGVEMILAGIREYFLTPLV